MLRTRVARSKQGTPGRPNQMVFRGSLVRTVVISLLLLWLLPFILIGALNYYRSNDLLEHQTFRQLETISERQSSQLREYIEIRDTALSELIASEHFSQVVQTLLYSPVDSGFYADARSILVSEMQHNPRSAITTYFEQIWLVRPDGFIAYANDRDWVIENFGSLRITDPDLLSLLGTNKTQYLYNPATGFYQTMALFATRSFVDSQNQPAGTLIAIASTAFPYQVLTDAPAFLPETQSYFFTSQTTIVGPGDWGKISVVYGNLDIAQSLAGIINNTQTVMRFLPGTFPGQDRVAYAQWFPQYNLGLLQTFPVQALAAQNTPFDAFNLSLIGASLLLFGMVVYFGTTRLVRPLVQLAQAVDRFAHGNWNQRATVGSQDEIGLLAFSFNKMAEELSGMYQSLEAVVEKRTSQLRTAAEVGQMATMPGSAAPAVSQDILGRTAHLVAERFASYHVAVYLAEESGKGLILNEAAGTASLERKQRGDRLPIDTSNLPGWVAVNRKPRWIAASEDEQLFRPDDLLPETRAQLCVPLSAGVDLFGVLEIHTTEAEFDSETITVFQTLANQISTTLQNTRLLEVTQVSYQETALLYQVTRQVTQANSEEETIQRLVEAMKQMPYLGMLLKVEESHFQLQVLTDTQLGGIDSEVRQVTIPSGRMAQTLMERGAVLIEDLNRPTEFEQIVTILRRRGCTTVALIGVFAGAGRLNRIFVLGARGTVRLSGANLQPYVNLAEATGAALEKFHALQTLQMRLTEQQVIASFSAALSAETDLQHLYAAMHRQVALAMGADLEFAVAVTSEQNSMISFPYFYEQGQMISIPPMPVGEGLTSVLIQERKPLLLPDEKSIRARSSRVVGQPARSWMGIPLIAGGTLFGAIILQDLAKENRFTQTDVDLFLTMAPQIANVIRNTQLYTETQQALLAYDQERFLLKTLLANIPEGVSFKNASGQYLRASESLAALLGIGGEDLPGKRDHDLFESETAQAFASAEAEVLRSGQPEIGSIEQIRSRDGDLRWMQTARIPMQFSEGTEPGLLVIHRDITALKSAEALAMQRAGQVKTAAEVARDATATLDRSVLLHNAVNLVRERFGFYHAAIFLLDASKEYAVLRESTGEAGQQMRKAGHKLALKSRSIVGQAAATGTAVIVNDVSSNATHLPNPLLPDTRSELALPLMVGGHVLGALDVQSTQVDAFQMEDVSVLQMLADQLAVAMENSSLFERTQNLLDKHRVLRQITSRASAAHTLDDALTEMVRGLVEAKIGERVAMLMANPDGTLQVRAYAGYESKFHPDARILPGQGIAGCAAVERRLIYAEDTRDDQRYMNIDPSVRSELALPVLFNEQVIGVLDLGSTNVAAFTESDQEILLALSSNFGGILSNITLLQQVQQQVKREQQLYAVTSKIRRSVNLQNILETTSKELCTALGARRVRVEITAGENGTNVRPEGNS